jgi:hypothetical protein
MRQLNGKVFDGSVAAGDALERIRFEYTHSSELAMYYTHKWLPTTACVEAVNQAGYRIHIGVA